MGALARLGPLHPQPPDLAGQRRQGGRRGFEGLRQVVAFADHQRIGPPVDGEGQRKHARRMRRRRAAEREAAERRRRVVGGRIVGRARRL